MSSDARARWATVLAAVASNAATSNKELAIQLRSCWFMASPSGPRRASHEPVAWLFSRTPSTEKTNREPHLLDAPATTTPTDRVATSHGDRRRKTDLRGVQRVTQHSLVRRRVSLPRLRPGVDEPLRRDRGFPWLVCADRERSDRRRTWIGPSLSVSVVTVAGATRRNAPLLPPRSAGRRTRA